MTAPFKMFGGHAALDLVNTLDNRFVDSGPDEGLRTFGDLLAFVRQTGLADGARVAASAAKQRSAAAESALGAARELREALAATLYGMLGKPAQPPGDHLRVLKRHILDANHHRELVWQPASNRAKRPPRARWTWGSSEACLELPVWMLAHSAADLLTSEAMAQVHLCGSATCRWLFLDSSKNHSRRWCDMKVCGNRMKARRHYARQQSE